MFCNLHFQTDKVPHLQITANDQFDLYDFYVTRIHKFHRGHFDICIVSFCKQYLEIASRQMND